MSAPLTIVEFGTRHISDALSLRLATARAHHALHPQVFVSAPDEGGIWRELHAYVPRWRWGKRRYCFGLTALQDSVFCGYLLFAVYPQKDALFEKALAAMVVDIAVPEPLRRNGVGRALIERFVLDASKRGAKNFYANVWRGNDASEGLFAKAGFNLVCQTYQTRL